MSIEVIQLRSFAETDRAEVQRTVAQKVEQDPEKFLTRYAADPHSHGGRYVNSDLMKEMFEEYRQSWEARSRYNTAVHNSAAVLASEQFRRVITDDSDASRDTSIFLTGIPGAGKTTYVLSGGIFSPFARVATKANLLTPILPCQKFLLQWIQACGSELLSFTLSLSELFKIPLNDSGDMGVVRASRRWRVFKATFPTALRSFKSILVP